MPKTINKPLTPLRVIKRDLNETTFDSNNIYQALLKSGLASREFNEVGANKLTEQVVDVLSFRFGNLTIPTVEQVQDVVEHCLAVNKYFNTAKAYILYREKHKQIRENQKTLLDVTQSVEEYLSQSDWRVKANANQGFSLGGLILNVSGKVIANYWLNHIYSPEIGQAHRNADLHIHDLDMLAGYCAGWSLKTLLHEGDRKSVV